MHPTDVQLVEYVLEGDLSARVRESIGRHLGGGCEECGRRIREVEQLVAAMRTDRNPEPPAVWVERAIALRSTTLLDRVREWCSGLREVAGELVFDSLSQPELGLAGVRRADAARRLRFLEGDVELDLQVEPAGRGSTVTGQLLLLRPDPAPLAGARVLLTSGLEGAVEASTDEFGEFSAEIADSSGIRILVIVANRVVRFVIPDSPDPD